MGREDARRAVVALHDGTEPSTAEYGALRNETLSYLRGAWPDLSAQDAGDAADEAITRVVQHRDRLDGLTPAQMLGYLMRVVRNVQIDRFRGLTRESPNQDLIDRIEDVDDSEILSLLDREATLATVQSALTTTFRQGDYTTFRVIGKWLELAETIAAAPSDRAVGIALGLAHTTVADCRMRFMQQVRAQIDRE